MWRTIDGGLLRGASLSASDRWMVDHGLSFPVAVDDDQGTIARALGVPGFPMLHFVAPDGTVRFAASGEVDEATLVDAISRLS